MAAKTGTNMRVIVIGLLLTVFLCGSPRVEAGRCIGADRARIVRIFELFSFRIQEKIASWVHNLRTRLVELRHRSIPLAIVVFKALHKCKSREAVHRLLVDEVYQPDKIDDELKKLVDRALLINSEMFHFQEVPAEWRRQFVSESLAKWHRLFVLTAASFQVCRAMRQKSPKTCVTLEPLDPDLKEGCEHLVLRIGVLYQGNCSDEAVDLMATAWRREPDAIRTFCQAIRERDPGLCVSDSTDPPWYRILCQALAGKGETVCGDSVLGTDESRDCRNEVRIWQATAGKTPLSTIQKELKGASQFVLPALTAARSGITCEQLVLDIYDENTAELKLFTNSF